MGDVIMAVRAGRRARLHEKKAGVSPALGSSRNHGVAAAIAKAHSVRAGNPAGAAPIQLGWAAFFFFFFFFLVGAAMLTSI